MFVSMIAALGPKGEIGLDNKLLWHLSEDLKNFKKVTTGKMVVMGRKTFESIGKALPNRTNIVITRDIHFAPPGVIVVHDPMMVFDLALETEEELGLSDMEMVIIGGGEVYQFFLSYSQRLYLSYVNYEGPADAFFPVLVEKDWEEKSIEKFDQFTFKILERV